MTEKKNKLLNEEDVNHVNGGSARTFILFQINEDYCLDCLQCLNSCPTGAVYEKGSVCRINPDLCIGCGECEQVCPSRAVHVA